MEKQGNLKSICANCKYQDTSFWGSDNLCCHRYAPMVSCEHPKYHVFWPTVEKTDWCGEFEPQQETLLNAQKRVTTGTWCFASIWLRKQLIRVSVRLKGV